MYGAETLVGMMVWYFKIGWYDGMVLKDWLVWYECKIGLYDGMVL